MVRAKLGQHFLLDAQIASREIDYASIQPNETVLEIGPGKGILTRFLAQHAAQVIAIEIDPHMIQELTQWIPKNVLLIHGDALTIDFTSLPPFTKIVANLPFQISSPITFKFLNYPFKKAVLIYQKDFAERMVAHPGCKEYSRLSVNVYYKAYCRMLETIPRTCFFPSPKVDSCIVELIPRERPPFFVSNEPFFFELVKILFSHRRKKIKNSLAKVYLKNFDALPFLMRRIEELSPEEIGELSNALYILNHQ